MTAARAGLPGRLGDPERSPRTDPRAGRQPDPAVGYAMAPMISGDWYEPAGLLSARVATPDQLEPGPPHAHEEANSWS